MPSVLAKVFGTKYERDIKKIQPLVDETNRVYEELRDLPEDEFLVRTDRFREEFRADRREYLEETLPGLLDNWEERLDVYLDTTVALWGDMLERDLSREIDAADRKLRAEEFKKRAFERREKNLNELLPEAFATVKEGARRLLGKKWDVTGHEVEWDMVHFDVQLVGGVALHQGRITEMATGEGKTLVATLPIYLNGLTGDGVHLITVNDYLARRDSEWMGGLLEYLGVSVGCIQGGMYPKDRREQYARDVTYGTMERLVRRQREMSGQLIAEAEKYFDEGEDEEAVYNLLKVSKATPKNKKLLKMFEDPKLKKAVQRAEMDLMRDKKMHEVAEELYFALDEKGHSVELSEMGRQVLSPSNPALFELPDIDASLSEIDGDESLGEPEKERLRNEVRAEFEDKNEKLHNISQLLRAYLLFEKDVEYVVKENKIVIVDEYTGRLMPSRRYSDGLHQALEAKEGVEIERENITLATITIQNYFRMYDKLAGMTGTAETEAAEFHDIYKLDVMVIPTNEPVRRVDYDDVIYRTKREKYAALIEEIERMYEVGRPVLVGTVSVEVSELISRMLKAKGIPHEVLNAKNHQREAEIVALAGQPRSVTIATNMAGRGTDIKLSPEIVQCELCAIITRKGDPPPDHPEWVDECRYEVPCGLHIVGTERHDARRIDRQLRGRSGRQGDAGSSRFFLSLEDDLMRLFGSDRIAGILSKMGMDEGEPIEHGMITKNIERAQRRVEETHFSMRKRVLEYDDVMNKQREIIYEMRNQVLHGENLRNDIFEIISGQVSLIVPDYCPEELDPEGWDLFGLSEWVRTQFGIQIDTVHFEKLSAPYEVEELIMDAVEALYDKREELNGPELMRQIERFVMLSTLDENWQEHLTDIRDLREGIGLRAYGQRDPLVEYKKEAFEMFSDLVERIDEEIASKIFRVHARHETAAAEGAVARKPELQRIVREGEQRRVATNTPEETTVQTVRRTGAKIGRNDPCPCGSGKKYKKCCGKKSE